MDPLAAEITAGLLAGETTTGLSAGLEAGLAALFYAGPLAFLALFALGVRRRSRRVAVWGAALVGSSLVTEIAFLLLACGPDEPACDWLRSVDHLQAVAAIGTALALALALARRWRGAAAAIAPAAAAGLFVTLGYLVQVA